MPSARDSRPRAPRSPTSKASSSRIFTPTITGSRGGSGKPPAPGSRCTPITGRDVDIERIVDEIRDWLAQAGVERPDAADLEAARIGVKRYVDVVRPDLLVDDGGLLKLDGWMLRAIATPGHSPGHLCFAIEGTSILLTGDHVLPRITPNVSFHPQSGPNPLGAYLASLERLRGLPVDVALPCHGRDIVNLETRIDELLTHHEERLDEVRALLADGAETVWDVTGGMDWAIPWNEQGGFVRRSALGEAHAHLILLERRGLVARVGERPHRWRIR
jgi:glyoxylase-like metal-dependent hydrolase (beta-lactamase superfamily II)